MLTVKTLEPAGALPLRARATTSERTPPPAHWCTDARGAVWQEVARINRQGVWGLAWFGGWGASSARSRGGCAVTGRHAQTPACAHTTRGPCYQRCAELSEAAAGCADRPVRTAPGHRLGREGKPQEGARLLPLGYRAATLSRFAGRACATARAPPPETVDHVLSGNARVRLRRRREVTSCSRSSRAIR